MYHQRGARVNTLLTVIAMIVMLLNYLLWSAYSIWYMDVCICVHEN